MLEPQQNSVPHERKLWRGIFVGPTGVRAGWRLLVFLAIVAVLATLARPLLARIGTNLAEHFSPANVIMAEVPQFLIVLIAAAIMARFERRKLAEFGLPLRRAFGKHFWMGAAWGFGMLSVIIALMAATHTYTAGGFALSPSVTFEYAALWAVGCLTIGLFEEFAFRGYMQYTLTTGMGFWPAAALTCTLFALAHSSNPGETWVGIVEVVLIALFLCTALRCTGTLWFAVGWHMAFDWGESFFYSTPDSGIHAVGHMLKASLMGSKWLSGGTVGPEASVFDVFVTLAGILLLTKMYPEAEYPLLATPLIEPQSPAELAAADANVPGH